MNSSKHYLAAKKSITKSTNKCNLKHDRQIIKHITQSFFNFIVVF